MFSHSVLAQIYSKGCVAGTVNNADQNHPLEFVSISLLNARDSLPTDGTIKDAKGNFTIDKIHNETYFVQYRFIGYQIVNSQSFEIIKCLLQPIVRKFVSSITKTNFYYELF